MPRRALLWPVMPGRPTRQTLTVAGTALEAKGYVEATEIAPLIGALLIIGWVVKSVADKQGR